MIISTFCFGDAKVEFHFCIIFLWLFLLEKGKFIGLAVTQMDYKSSILFRNLIVYKIHVRLKQITSV